jgi:ankyrin repeat protein
LLLFFKNGTAALMYVSENGYFDIVKFLIANNADMNIQDNVFIFFNFFLILKIKNSFFIYYFY